MGVRGTACNTDEFTHSSFPLIGRTNLTGSVPLCAWRELEQGFCVRLQPFQARGAHKPAFGAGPLPFHSYMRLPARMVPRRILSRIMALQPTGICRRRSSPSVQRCGGAHFFISPIDQTFISAHYSRLSFEFTLVFTTVVWLRPVTCPSEKQSTPVRIWEQSSK